VLFPAVYRRRLSGYIRPSRFAVRTGLAHTVTLSSMRAPT
jgi:hypothetical protein